MLPPDAVLVALLLSLSQAAPIDGTWELARIFRSGATAGTRVVPIDSTVYVRLTLETHPGGWMGGRLYRRYFGQPEGSKIEAGPPPGPNPLLLRVGPGKPPPQRARSAARAGGAPLGVRTPPPPPPRQPQF